MKDKHPNYAMHRDRQRVTTFGPLLRHLVIVIFAVCAFVALLRWGMA